ncbi:hypothetical protein HOP62_05355 [Halomonas sp. MCCC 1A17488]|uniref:hypothetical protein n=1 Tax=unclassified Halomonas TaxID=2609666 RepID=UPI0018D24FFE|nr:MULTISPECIES: hypothetical protein [unclassified Halomonas]MCE8015503.1 hypothetical protein [Halomonas sp. MCCC 1A17488]MCG3238836.1 hypothetical protein [Halomonas sp. MCCC 1A17488]QPP51202.1 hypothetical protein I4484_09045 [Halomonas sp. SS10-MC5]
MSSILKQGHLDGLCLVYAVANAFKALKYPRRSASWFVDHQSHVWRKLVSVTPSLHNFVSGEGSAFELSTDSADVLVKERLLELYAAVIGERKREEYEARRVPLEELSSAIGESSAGLVCLRTSVETGSCTIGEHWVCVVDADQEQYYLACSYTDHLVKGGEPEHTRLSPLLNRPFNNTLPKRSVNKTSVYENSVYHFRVAY